MRAIGARLLPCFQAGLSKEPRGRHRPRRAPFLTHATEQNRSIGPAAGGGRVPESGILGFRESRGGISGRDLAAGSRGGFAAAGISGRFFARIRPRGNAARREPERENPRFPDPEIPAPGASAPGCASGRLGRPVPGSRILGIRGSRGGISGAADAAAGISRKWNSLAVFERVW